MKQSIKKQITDNAPRRSRTDFTQLPNQVMRDHRLTQSDKIVYWVLKSHAWNGKSISFPSTRRIAEECGVSAHHVSKRTKSLEKWGYIVIERILGEVNRYHFPSNLPPLNGEVPPTRCEKESPQLMGRVPPESEKDPPQKVRTKHTNTNILTKTYEDNHTNKNHTKYDSYAEVLRTSPNGSDPREGSEFTSAPSTEEGKKSTTLQYTVGVAASVKCNDGMSETEHSAQPAQRKYSTEEIGRIFDELFKEPSNRKSSINVRNNVKGSHYEYS